MDKLCGGVSHRSERPNGLPAHNKLLILSGDHKSVCSNNDDITVLFLDKWTFKSDDPTSEGVWTGGNFHMMLGLRGIGLTQNTCI